MYFRGIATAAVVALVAYLGIGALIWAFTAAFGEAIPPIAILAGGAMAGLLGFVALVAMIPAMRALVGAGPGWAALAAYAGPWSVLSATALYGASATRFDIAAAWGRADRPLELSGLAQILSREGLITIGLVAATLAVLLVAIPFWLRVWDWVNPRRTEMRYESGSAGDSEYEQMMQFNRRLVATRQSASEFRMAPRRIGSEFSERPDIEVVMRDSGRTTPTWMLGSMAINNALGRPALVLFLIGLIVRAFVSDPSFDRFPPLEPVTIYMDQTDVAVRYSVPLGPAIEGLRIFAVDGSGTVVIAAPEELQRPPGLFPFDQAGVSPSKPYFDVDLRGDDGGRGLVELESLGPRTVRLRAQLVQQISTAERYTGAAVAIATALMATSAMVLLTLGLSGLSAYWRR